MKFSSNIYFLRGRNEALKAYFDVIVTAFYKGMIITFMVIILVNNYQ